MNTTDSLLEEVARTRAELAAVEAKWKSIRAHSRALALSLLLDHGYTVNKVAVLTGHQRATLLVWLNAAQGEALRSSATAKQP